jgi:hypothetical protein
MPLLPKLGIGGTIGFLVGLGLVSWVQPTERGGVTLLVVIPVIVGIAIGGILSRIFGGRSL